jgi:hypothetical protein
MSAGWLKLVKNPAMNRSQRTRPTQFYLCKMHRHQIRQSMSRFAEVPYYEKALANTENILTAFASPWDGT